MATLPTFFIIGASKAGTTSLHWYLDAHPEIAMTDPKEPHWLIGPGWQQRIPRYSELFAASKATIRGEASPGYAVFPNNPEAASNIAAVVPHARIIYLVRDPVERAIAQYAQHLTVGTESRPPERALDLNDPHCEYLAASRYATQVENYRQHFPADAILVIDQVDLRERRREALERVFRHVGADSSFWTATVHEHDYNVRGEDNVVLPPSIDRLRSGRLNSLSKRLVPQRPRSAAIRAARRFLGREVRPEVSDELRTAMAGALTPEVARLRRLTGGSFATWSI